MSRSRSRDPANGQGARDYSELVKQTLSLRGTKQELEDRLQEVRKDQKPGSEGSELMRMHARGRQLEGRVRIEQAEVDRLKEIDLHVARRNITDLTVQAQGAKHESAEIRDAIAAQNAELTFTASILRVWQRRIKVWTATAAAVGAAGLALGYLGVHFDLLKTGPQSVHAQTVSSTQTVNADSSVKLRSTPFTINVFKEFEGAAAYQRWISVNLAPNSTTSLSATLYQEKPTSLNVPGYGSYKLTLERFGEESSNGTLGPVTIEVQKNVMVRKPGVDSFVSVSPGFEKGIGFLGLVGSTNFVALRLIIASQPEGKEDEKRQKSGEDENAE